MDDQVFDLLIDNVDEKIGEVIESSNDSDAASLLVDAYLEPGEFYEIFDTQLKKSEKEFDEKVSSESNYYLIEMNEDDEYMVEVKSKPEHLVYYIPKLCYDHDLKYNEINSCYSLADMVDNDTDVTDNYNMIDVALTVILIYLETENKIGEFEEFELLGNAISWEKYNQIAEDIAEEIDQVQLQRN